MSLFDFLKPFVSERYFEKQKAGQTSAASRFLKLLSHYDKHLNELRQVEFFFYGKNMGNAISLKKDLLKQGYKVYGIEGSMKSEFSIMGITCPVSLEDSDFRKWIEKMNELGFINDCRFDGWGVLTKSEDGSAFSDD
jgi:hypothetical protein